MPEEDGPALDVDRIVEVLAQHDVAYLLIGGVAARLYGVERVTRDFDVVCLRDVDNLDRLADALRELGAFLRVGGMDDETARALPVLLDGPALAAMEISTWRTEAGDVDVLANLRSASGERLEFGDLVARASSTSVGGVTVRLAGLDDIINSKRFANRDKDAAALPELEQLRDIEDA
ncbi:MAG: hypothetical protein JWM05_1795 [Acidimicrobiales bacterium]|nr:hypothetical protein [Acidimicrobiales bacterium]